MRHVPWLWLSVLAALVACSAGESGGADTVPAKDAIEASDAMEAFDATAAETRDGVGDTVPVDALGDREARLAALAETFEAERAQSGAPGAAMVVMLDGQVARTFGSGTRRVVGGDPVDGDTRFRIGSLTKMLSAIALLQQVEQGHVALDDLLVTHVPAFHLQASPDPVGAITVRHLLTHASGIVDYLEIDAPAATCPDACLNDFLTGDFGTIGYVMFPPGRMYDYSNPGFALVGLLVEKASGAFYRPYMREHVFQPLGLERTTFDPAEVMADGNYAEATGHHWTTGASVTIAPDSYDNAWAAPAGYAFSTVNDLARVATFLMHGDPAVLAPELLAQMTAEQVVTDELLDLSWYGFGLAVSRGLLAVEPGRWHPVRVLAHDGGIPGYSALLFVLPEAGFAVATLASGEGAYFPQTVAQAVYSLAPLPATVPAPDLVDDPTRYPDYVGEYVDPFGIGRIVLSTDGETLSMALPDLDAAGIAYDATLQPVSPRNYLATVDGNQIPATVVLDATGKGEYVRTRSAVAKRVVPPQVPAPLPKARAQAFRQTLRRAAPAPATVPAAVPTW
jgi:CubicO group peptidase (beta-lactamase class C family)